MLKQGVQGVSENGQEVVTIRFYVTETITVFMLPYLACPIFINPGRGAFDLTVHVYIYFTKEVNLISVKLSLNFNGSLAKLVLTTSRMDHSDQLTKAASLK